MIALISKGGNARALLHRLGMFTRDAVPVSYDGETEAARRARRKANWTPAVVVVEDGGAYGVG